MSSNSNSGTPGPKRYWVFTINNPQSELDEPACWDRARIKYCVYQLEAGEQGVYHYQGYLIFNRAQRLTMCKRICARAHWEPRRGTHEEAKAYCNDEKKRVDGTDVVEFGEHGFQGKRNDLEAVKEILDNGGTMKEVADLHFAPFVRNFRGFNYYLALSRPKMRDWITFTTVLWGPPGTGKTKRAHWMAGEDSYWMQKPSSNTLFFDGYDRQTTVVIDEFFGWIRRDMMCRMSDRYPLNVHVKGGAVGFMPRQIIITSNKHPRDWWPNIGLGPMERRLEGEHGEIIAMPGPGVWEPEVQGPVNKPDFWQPRDVELEALGALAGMKRPRYDSDLEEIDEEESSADVDEVRADEIFENLGNLPEWENL